MTFVEYCIAAVMVCTLFGAIVSTVFFVTELAKDVYWKK